jgi:hypothetical protein
MSLRRTVPLSLLVAVLSLPLLLTPAKPGRASLVGSAAGQRAIPTVQPWAVPAIVPAADSAEVAVAGPGPSFQGVAVKLDRDLRKRMTGVSWHRGCPVPLAGLRLLKVTHWGFDGRVHRGRLVVNADSAKAMLTVMRRLFHFRFPIRRMRLVDAYGANDRRSMNADNTSAFNCREISGRPGVWSQHAYGRAIDLNPFENPYVSGSYVSPSRAKRFATRRPVRKGMIAPRGNVVRIFGRAGWEWGGNWYGYQDYQHFSATGT